MRRLILVLALSLVILAGGISMTHGRPDYGVGGAKATTYALEDMAELAARLGSPVTFDRLGDVVWFDDFEDGLLKVTYDWAGINPAFASSTERARNGGKSVKMTSGSGALGNVRLIKYVPFPVKGKLGVEFSFAVHSDVQRIHLALIMYTGVKRLDADVRLDRVSEKLQWLGPGEVWQDLASGIKCKADDILFHTLKLVADYENETFTRLLYDHLGYAMSSYPLLTSANTTDPHLLVDIRNYATAGDSRYMYVDDLIITQNEP